MYHVIKESEISETEVKRFTEALLVLPGDRSQGVPVWSLKVLPSFSSAHAPAKVTEGHTLYVEVENPDDADTRNRVRTALFAQMRT